MAVVGYVKKKNMLDIMRCMKFYGPLTKSDIMKRTGLTMGTVNTFINRLLDLGIIEDTGISPSTGGRKAVLYGFNPNSFFIVGISISIEKLSIAVFDINLNIINRSEERTNLSENTVDDSIQHMIDSIMKITRESGVAPEKVLGIGISVPGLVDYDRGVVLEIPHAAAWRNVPLKRVVQGKTGIHVVMDNDNNSNVLWLKWENPQYSSDNLIYLSSVEGIGVGILLNGAVYRGSRYLAGEIGHVSINPEGEKCSCGNRGCIELYASNLGIVHTVRGLIRDGASSLLNELCSGDIQSIDIFMIVEAAKAGDAFCIEALHKAAGYLSICIDYAIKAYDPDIIMLDSYWLPLFQEIKNRVIESVFERTDFIKRDDMRIVMSNTEDLFLKGAATLIVEEKFSEDSEDGVFWVDNL